MWALECSGQWSESRSKRTGQLAGATLFGGRSPCGEPHSTTRVPNHVKAPRGDGCRAPRAERCERTAGSGKLQVAICSRCAWLKFETPTARRGLRGAGCGVVGKSSASGHGTSGELHARGIVHMPSTCASKLCICYLSWEHETRDPRCAALI